MRTHCRTIQNHFKNLILQEEHYYDDRYYEYSYEYADTTEPEYIEAKAEEALENVPNQLSKRKRRQINDYPEEEAEENVKLLCCSFQKYLHCSETVVNTTCGYETAQFTKSFLDRMSGPLIQVLHKKNEFWHENSNFISFQGHCQAYEYGSNGCTTNEYEYSAGQYYNHASGHLIMSLPLTLLFVICARLL